MAHGNFGDVNSASDSGSDGQFLAEKYPNLVNFKSTASFTSFLAIFIVGSADSSKDKYADSGVYTKAQLADAAPWVQTTGGSAIVKLTSNNEQLFPKGRCATQKFEAMNRTMCTGMNGTVATPSDCAAGLVPGVVAPLTSGQVADNGINPIKKVQRLFSVGRRSFMPNYDRTATSDANLNPAGKGSFLSDYGAFDACTDGCCCNSTTGQVQVATGSSTMTGSC